MTEITLSFDVPHRWGRKFTHFPSPAIPPGMHGYPPGAATVPVPDTGSDIMFSCK